MKFTMWHVVSAAFVSLLAIAIAQKDPHYVANRTTMVHLFEWKFEDIAKECERFLGPMGYAGVQVSPINENVIVPKRPWYERYQPISYKILTRSGDEAAFRDMVARCNKVGVRTYVDTVINHMTGNQIPAVGTGGTQAVAEDLSYPGVPYNSSDFHKPCPIDNYQDPVNVRDCELSGLHDLDQSKEHVRASIVEFMNRGIDMGIAGFRIDAAKHMWPKDLEIIYGRLRNLDSRVYGPNKRPFIYQEVPDYGGEAVKQSEYTGIGRVVEFKYGVTLGNMFRGKDNLARLYNFGDPQAWYMPEPGDSLVMVDNHDTQRMDSPAILTYKLPKQYKMAVAFSLAYPYGTTRVMSSFAFEDPNAGPPADAEERLLSPEISNGRCTNGWVCEHRWPQIYNMVRFRNLVNKEQLQNWWSNGSKQIAFSRGDKGFVAFNVEGQDLRQKLQTGLPAGIYCDVISGGLINGKCSGESIRVEKDGTANISIPANATEGALAIHVKVLK